MQGPVGVSRKHIFKTAHNCSAALPDWPGFQRAVWPEAVNQRVDQLLLQGARDLGVRDDLRGFFDQSAGGVNADGGDVTLSPGKAEQSVRNSVGQLPPRSTPCSRRRDVRASKQ